MTSSNLSVAASQARSHFGRLGWDDRDRWPALTKASVALVALAAVFARFGLPNVPLMWPLHRLGLVLPGCGLTRGVVAIFRGDPARAWMFNPASFVVVLLAAAFMLRLAVTIVTHRWLVPPLPRHRLFPILGGGAVIVLWVNQQSHAALLIHQLR